MCGISLFRFVGIEADNIFHERNSKVIVERLIGYVPGGISYYTECFRLESL